MSADSLSDAARAVHALIAQAKTLCPERIPAEEKWLEALNESISEIGWEIFSKLTVYANVFDWDELGAPRKRVYVTRWLQCQRADNSDR